MRRYSDVHDVTLHIGRTHSTVHFWVVLPMTDSCLGVIGLLSKDILARISKKKRQNANKRLMKLSSPSIEYLMILFSLKSSNVALCRMNCSIVGNR